MAFLRDKKTSLVITNVNNITVDLPDNYEAGDLLMLLVSKDTTTGGVFSTPSGWTKLAEELQGTAVRGAVYYKENVSASETAPNISSTDNDTWSAIAMAWGGVSASNVIGAFNAENWTFGSSHERDAAGITTQENNSVVAWLFATDGAAQAIGGRNSRLINYDDGVGCSAVGWYSTFPSAGATGTYKAYSGGTENVAAFCIEIKDGSSGNDVQAYVEGGIDAENVVNLFQGIETNSYAPGGTGATGVNSGINQTPLITSLAGKAVQVTNTVQDQADANAMPYARAARIETDRSATIARGLTFDVDPSGANGTIDLSGDRYFHVIMHSRDLKVHSLGGQVEEFGRCVALHDAAGNWKAWGVDGRDASRKLASPIAGPVVIDLDSDENLLGSSGTLNRATIQHMSFLSWAQLANNYYAYVCNAYRALPFSVLGGSVNFPASIGTLVEHLEAKGELTFSNIGEGTFVLRAPVIFGNDGGDDYVGSIEGQSLIIASSEPAQHITEDFLGITVKPGGSLNASGSSVSSGTAWKLDIQSGASPNFSSAVISNTKTCNIRGDFQGSIMSPKSGEVVNDYGANIDAMRVNGDLVIHSVKNLSSLTVTGTLEITTAGTYNLDACEINEITNSSGGNVVLNLSNGSTVSVNSGPNIQINNSKTISFNISFAGVDPVDYEWRLYEEDVTPGIVGTVDLAGAENETSLSVEYVYEYVSDQKVTLQIIADGFIEKEEEYTLLNQNQSFNVGVSRDFNL